jgi:hypothetical protein
VGTAMGRAHLLPVEVSCAKESAIAPSAPRLIESPFSWRVGSLVVSKDLARLLKLSFGTAALFSATTRQTAVIERG